MARTADLKDGTRGRPTAPAAVERIAHRTIRKGDCILQTPGIKHREIACSDDFEVLEIVSPANFATRIVEAPGLKAEAAE